MAISVELSADYVCQQISKGMHDELEKRIRNEIKKNVDSFVEEAAREIAKNIKANLVGYRLFGPIGSDQIILHMNIDGVEKAKL